MRRAQPLAVTAPLMPVIGGASRERSRRQRAGAGLHWRRPAAARDYPALNLTIRPAFEFRFELGMLQRDVQHFSAAMHQAGGQAAPVAGPRGPAGERTAQLHWRSAPQPPDTHGPVTLGRSPAQFVVQARRALASPHAEAPVADARNRRVTVTLPTWRKTRVFSPEVRTVSASSQPAAPTWPRSNDWRRTTMAEPGGAATAARSKASMLSDALPRALVPQATWAPAPRLPRADLAFATLELRRGPSPSIVTRSIAIRSPRPSPSAQPRVRRAAVDLAWQSRSEAPATAQDLASLARSLSAPEFTRTVSVTRSASPAHNPQIPAALPDTGRIVDEVIDRIDRRMRSDRLRRGL